MKVAVVTGASGDIGGAIASRLVRSGYFVVAQYSSNLDGIEKIKKDLNGEGLSDYVFGVCADFSTQDGYEKVTKAVKDSFKHIDVIVNCAGVDLYKSCSETTACELNKVLTVNFNSSFMLTGSLIDLMRNSDVGKIVFVSSIWGSVGASMESAYSASKSALIGLTKSLAKELSGMGVTVNCVCPGVIDTKMNDRFNEEEKTDLIERTPLKRFGTVLEVASLVDYLCSEKANFITGQVITIDGGFTL